MPFANGILDLAKDFNQGLVRWVIFHLQQVAQFFYLQAVGVQIVLCQTNRLRQFALQTKFGHYRVSGRDPAADAIN